MVRSIRSSTRLFQLGAGQLDDEMLRDRVCVGGDERQVDFRLLGGRQLDLGLFRGFLQALQRQLVLAQVDAARSFLNSSAER